MAFFITHRYSYTPNFPSLFPNSILNECSWCSLVHQHLISCYNFVSILAKVSGLLTVSLCRSPFSIWNLLDLQQILLTLHLLSCFSSKLGWRLLLLCSGHHLVIFLQFLHFSVFSAFFCIFWRGNCTLQTMSVL